MTPALAIVLLARSVRRYAEHPLATEALAEVRSLVGTYVERQHEPHRWARFHERMAATLPTWRRLARGHHARLARRYRAHAWATDPLAASSCSRAGLFA